jgi:Leucine-rich repeat (LRR) protein
MNGTKTNNTYEIKDLNEMNYFEDEEEMYKDCDKVEKIELTYSNIKIIPETFINFLNLKYLDLSGNQIDNIKNISQCFKIEFLNLSNNLLKIIDGINNLKKLQILDLSYNHILINNSFLSTLKGNKELRNLYLDGNMNYEFNTVKFYCLENLINLEVLDKVVIFKKKKNISAFQNVDNRNVKLKDYIKNKKIENKTDKKKYTSDNLIDELKTKHMDILSSYYFSNIKYEKK